MVDDATSRSEGRFSTEETTWAAAAVLRRWIEQHGVPLALHTDWKNVYVRAATTSEPAVGLGPLTQFGRMCAALQIQIIPASSPQAKGCVERNHGTHQDRLVKKLRRLAIAAVRHGACAMGYFASKRRGRSARIGSCAIAIAPYRDMHTPRRHERPNALRDLKGTFLSS